MRMWLPMNYKKKTAQVWIYALLVLLISGAKAEGELFPASPAVQRRVNFWIKALTEYSKEQVILHDSEYPEIIYEVVDMNGSSPYEYFSKRSRWQRVGSSRREIKNILHKLAGLKEPVDVTQLNEREREIYRMWSQVDNPRKFYLAQENLHAQQGLRALFQTGLARSGLYLDSMMVIFRQYGIPDDICYLPHVESAFNFRAYSKMGAAGVWQFTRSTGRLFMKIDYAIDERYDPYIATHAAARLMKKNHQELGTWPLAITAYNHGTEGIKRAKGQVGTDDLGEIIEKYDGRAFGFASKNFYAEFLAAVHVAKNYQKYFTDVQFEKPEKHQLFTVPNYITLDALCRKFDIDERSVAQLNPALRRPIIKSARRIPQGYMLRLPIQEGLDLQALYAQVPTAEKHEEQVVEKYYQVEPGDNLGSIARQFGTSAEVLTDLNNISNPRRLRVGQLLEMPESSRPVLLANNKSEKTHESPGGGMKVEPVSAPVVEATTPDTSLDLLVLARHHAGNDKGLYGPNLAEETLNGNTNWEFVVDFEEPQKNEVKIQPEETIGHLAEWLGTSPQHVRELNQLSYGEALQVGQRLKVSFSRVSPREFHRKRLEFHRSLQEDFFSNYRIDGFKSYIVKNGDSIWDLCNRTFDAPYWLLARYNKGVDMMKLQLGQQIKVPVLTPFSENTIVNQNPA